MIIEAKKPYIYISCLMDEQELPQVIRLCQWLISNGCTYAFVNYGHFAFKQFAAFVAVVGKGYNDASWLNGELHDACGLSRLMTNHRPFLFGLSIDGATLPRCSQGLPIHWLDLEQSYLQAEQSYAEQFLGADGEQPSV